MKTSNLDFIKYNVLTNFYRSTILLIAIVFIQFIIGGIILSGYSNYINKQMTYNIIEYSIVDFNKLCDISECKDIWIDGFCSDEIQKIYEPSENVFIDKNLNFIVYNKEAKAYFQIDTEVLEHLIIEYSSIITIILISIFSIITYYNIKKEREESLKIMTSNEAMLSNKSMILITENIHHELNTPMEVIDSKLSKIRKIIKAYNETKTSTSDIETLAEIQESFNNIDIDFNLISQASEQIYAVLERMRGFKHLRYSNGNKSIFDICTGTFKVMSISNSNFYSKVDDNLRRYSINSSELKNADLLNILLNHVKNSLEANANKVFITFESFNKNKVKIRIIDNGNGIKNISHKDMFEPNFSTKDIENQGIRGNGLFLNKSIMKSSGGDVKLIDSSNYGTTFEIIIPAKPREI
jgi:signal transduction histidine kinase